MVKLGLSYDELSSALGMSSIILSDKMVEEKLKNVIFIVKKDSVCICFYNSLTFCRTEVEKVIVEGIEDEKTWIFQVKAADLTKVLSGFSSLYKTKVDSIRFEENKSKIKISIDEVALEEADSRLNQTSVFNLDNVPLTESVRKDIEMEFPDDPEIVFKGDLDLYVSSLLPLMNSASNLESKLNFADDYVFVIAAYMSVFFKNKLSEQMKNMTLGYSSVSLIKRLCDTVEGDNILVKKTDKYLCMQAGNTEAFMRHQPVKIKYQQYIKMMSRDNGVVLNRLYFKDVLKRVGMVSTEGKLTILDDGDITIETPNFNQMIPTEKTRGEVSGVNFKFSINLFERLIVGSDKLVVGSDKIFPEEIFLYIVKAESRYALFFTDKKGAWFSMTQVH